MSTPNEPARQRVSLAGSAGRMTADGRLVYRLIPPLVVWWGWVGLTVLSLGDLVVQERNLSSLRLALGLLTATGVAFACTWWPKVIASDDGITVLNPFRRFDIPWGAVRGVYLAESVEVKCARADESKKDKTVYCWALSAPRRARARGQLRGRQWDQGRRSRPSNYDRLSAEARALATLTPSEIFARELAELVELHEPGQAKGAPSGAAFSARWAWPPVLVILAPAIALALAELVR